MILGHREIYRLASMNMVSRWEMMHHESLPWEPGEYSRRALCTALAAEVIAEAGERGDPQVAYTAGLTCDLGKLALAYGCAEYYPLISACAKHTAATWADAETSVLGYDQTEVGARLLRALRFPENPSPRRWNSSRAPPTPPPPSSPLSPSCTLRASSPSPSPRVSPRAATSSPSTAPSSPTTASPPSFSEEAMVEVRDRAYRRLGGRQLARECSKRSRPPA